jgi:single-stranded DNA-binding protein
MNNCTFIGKLKDDPFFDEVEKVDGSKTGVVSFELVIPRTFKKKTGGDIGKQDTTIYCEAWDSGAVVIANRFRKGDTIILYCSVRNTLDGTGGVYFRVDKFEFPDILGG